MANLDDDKLDGDINDNDADKGTDTALDDAEEGAEDTEDLDSWELEEDLKE